MTSLTQILYQSGITEVLVKSLLHTLWQATIIGLIFLLLLKILPTAKSAVRYKLGLVVLFAVLLSWLGTLSILNQKPAVNPPPSARATPPPAATPVFAESRTSFPTPVNSVVEPEQAPPVETAESRSKFSVPTILIMLWSAGVLLMIIRLFLALTGTRRHRRKSFPIEDPALLKRFDALCSIVGLHRKIIFAATSTLKNPGVIGIVKPMVLIPASMLTGFPASDLEAVVAHELAHIKRHDYLFNLLQMVIESLLFFNPAVWWISHRIRMEREACCDAEAMQATGQKFEYANLLLNEFGGQPATAMAFGNNKKEDAKERLLRIVHPNRKVDIKIGSLRLIILLAITSAAIVALAKTSDLAVKTVAKILTPKERVEKLIEIADQASPHEEITPAQKKRDPYDYTGAPRINVSGRVTTEDGSELLLESLRINYTSREQPTSPDPFESWKLKCTYESISIETDGTFSATNIPALGVQYFKVSSSNYCSTTFETECIEDITNVVLILPKGFGGVLMVQNEDGNPIPNASAQLMHPQVTVQGIGHQSSSYDFQRTDEKGRIEYPNQNTQPVAFDIHAKGYQSMDYYPASFAENKPLIIQMTKGHTIPGTVIDKSTGLPIEDAQIMLTDRNAQSLASGQMMTMSDDREIARTDQSGNFTIDTIGTNETFFITIHAPGKNPALVRDITAKTKQIDVQLIPKRTIRGTLTGDLSQLEDRGGYTQGNRQTSASIGYATRMRTSEYGRSLSSVPVTITNGVGHFIIEDLSADWVEISTPVTDRKIAEIWFSERSAYDLVINLDSNDIDYGPDSRVVELEIKTPAGLPPAEGMLELRYQTLSSRNSGLLNMSDVQVEISNGKGRTTIPAPAYITLFKSKDIKGYWIEPSHGIAASTNLVQPSAEPFIYSINATSAGGIHGNVFNADGQPTETFETFMIHKTWPKKSSHFWSLLSSQRHSESFAVTTIPINETVALLVNNGCEWIITEPMVLTEETAIQIFDLKFGPSKPIEGQILMPDGTPADHVYIQLLNNIEIAEGFSTYSYADGIQTDIDGRFRFDKVTIDPKFKYKLSISGHGKYKRQMIPVEPSSNKTYTHKLKK